MDTEKRASDGGEATVRVKFRRDADGIRHDTVNFPRAAFPIRRAIVRGTLSNYDISFSRAAANRRIADRNVRVHAGNGNTRESLPVPRVSGLIVCSGMQS